MNDTNVSDRRLAVSQPASGAKRNRDLCRDASLPDSATVFPTLEAGVTLLDGDHERIVAPLQSLVVDHLLLNDGVAFWVDVHGYATTTQFARIAPSQQLLDRVQVARGFTPYQHYSAICDLPAAIEAHSDEPALIVAPALDAHYQNEDTLPTEHAQTLLSRVLARLHRYADKYGVPVLVGRTSVDTATEPIAMIADRQLRCEQTPMGPQFVGDDFETTLYPVGDGLYQTTIGYWRGVLTARARQIGSPIDDAQLATSPTAPEPLAALQYGGR
ncbi:P-loop NTPase family protein [Halocatena halophila]|uniref:hypothetical protein n=1 Tax=Halocatena halophila TaxID=2814576 RepID=UPI002ED0621D